MAEFEHPGVFVEEIPLPIHSIEGVPTGTAGFVGYTERAVEPETGRALTGEPTLIAGLRDYERLFGGPGGAGYDLYAALRLFFENGGSRAAVVSVGPFGVVDAAQLGAGLDALDEEKEHAILLAPDALRLPKADYHAFAREMIERAAASKRRVAIVDLHGGGEPAVASEAGLAALLAEFRAAMAPLPADARSFGAAYHPFLLTGEGPVPPSAAIAGLWSRNDIDRGVWKAPANLAPSGAAGLSFEMSRAAQEGMNAPPDGLAVNVIRSVPGRGILVWGARTLDAGNGEYRYVSVRRTLIYIEQSVAAGLQSLVFEPNDAGTWTRARDVIDNFLQILWRAGSLQGAKPEAAFFVQCGLGTTMTQGDVDDGRLIVEIGMALVRPAEFVIIRIGQRMQAT
ncbi:MAG TPA: phage tail sheath C-terminal domain-containing protein [Allosphingosinicella sp.]|nr:phage tail sheath C-terminal domain-containing protein [Allosphingosinicella sp.]